jgi:hypothetical protein
VLSNCMKRLEMSNKPNNVRREVHPNQSTDLPMQKMGMTDQFELSIFRHWNKHPPEVPSVQGHMRRKSYFVSFEQAAMQICVNESLCTRNYARRD